MASWTTLINALFIPGKPILGSTGVSLRDNLQAYAERDSSLPVSYQPIYLLGTITTTSGATVSLSSLDLTGYKFLRCVLNGVSLNGAGQITLNSAPVNQSASAGENTHGIVEIDLATGVFWAATGKGAAGAGSSGGGASGVTNASTSITFGVMGTATAYDLGSIRVYGIK